MQAGASGERTSGNQSGPCESRGGRASSEQDSGGAAGNLTPPPGVCASGQRPPSAPCPPPYPRRERARARRVAAAGEQGPMPCAAARQGARLRRLSRCPPLRHKLTTHFQTATALVAEHRALLTAPRVTALVTAPRRGPCSVAAPSRSRHVLNTRPARPGWRGGRSGRTLWRSPTLRPARSVPGHLFSCGPCPVAGLIPARSVPNPR